MNEAAVNLLGDDITSKAGKGFAKEILNHMRMRIVNFQEEYGTLFNLEATPGEGTGYRLAKLDKEVAPEMFMQGDNEPFYTNSSQLPVSFTDDLFEALNHQDDLQTLYTGGTVFHSFIGEKIDDPRICRNLVRKIAENFHLPYFTITPTFTICPEHGYIAGEHFECPFDHGEGQEELQPSTQLVRSFSRSA
jgi:ribonucleoside-triphosphate reductase